MTYLQEELKQVQEIFPDAKIYRTDAEPDFSIENIPFNSLNLCQDRGGFWSIHLSIDGNGSKDFNKILKVLTALKELNDE